MTVQERRDVAIAAGAIAVWLACISGVIYVAVHFIMKFW